MDASQLPDVLNCTSLLSPAKERPKECYVARLYVCCGGDVGFVSPSKLPGGWNCFFVAVCTLWLGSGLSPAGELSVLPMMAPSPDIRHHRPQWRVLGISF